MPKATGKIFCCVHNSCVFETDKRKAIVTHLLRTHNERKEDFECDYCELLLTEEKLMELHLRTQHPSEPFRYTCVSRIEGIVNNCLKLGLAKGDNPTPAYVAKPPGNGSALKPKLIKSSPKSPGQNRSSLSLNIPKPVRNSPSPNHKKAKSTPSPKVKTTIPSLSAGNKLLNRSLKFQGSSTNGTEFTQYAVKEEPVDMDEYITDQTDADFRGQSSTEQGITDFDDNLMNTDSSNGSGEISDTTQDLDPLQAPETQPKLKIKLNLKNIKKFTSIAPKNRYLTPSRKNADSGRRFERSEPEVYHFIDRIGRRCCPFCPYKTTKNSIRIHLSGKHHLYFVQCSLCSFKGAFPHQVVHHGERSHPGEDFQVIQLSKENRENAIDDISQVDFEKTASTSSKPNFKSKKKKQKSNPLRRPPFQYNQVDDEYMEDEMYYSEPRLQSAGNSGSKVILAPKPRSSVSAYSHIPKCQTSKTPYYKIEYEHFQYVYKCTRCPFKTPVRATIYTHKYRHEESDYECAYCGYRSAPRSNVVFHCKSKHKNVPIRVLSCKRDSPEGHSRTPSEEDEVSLQEQYELEQSENMEEEYEIQEIKQEPLEATLIVPQKDSSKSTPSLKTIIKVPQFRRSLPPPLPKNPKPAIRRKPVSKAKSHDGYQMSTNKQYRINRNGNPKFLCVLCPYGADTHPKMKHHLYRHRPQRFKCPYCSHRKYPRSYVVRHVRDTHKDKPLRVLDLMMSDEVSLGEDELSMEEEGLAQLQDNEEMVEYEGEQTTEFSDQDQFVAENEEYEGLPIKQEMMEEDFLDEDPGVMEEENSGMYGIDVLDPSDQLRLQISQKRKDSLHLDVTSRLLHIADEHKQGTIESDLNDSADKPRKRPPNPSIKLSSREYSINHGCSPRYLCNRCDYTTDKYNTIHTHMYKHEKQMYECPYCGYRKSPRSYVESHIKDVHKNKPVFVRDLREEGDTSRMDDSETDNSQHVESKRNIDVTSPEDGVGTKKIKTSKNKSKSSSTTPKLNFKWPAPKSKNLVSVQSKRSSSSPNNMGNNSSGNTTPKNIQKNAHSRGEPMTGNTGGPRPAATEQSGDGKGSTGKKFLNKNNFKTLYKCVFDPETCHHISKDKSKMKQHLFHHVEYKPWTCNYCDMSGTQSSHVKNHIKSEHPEMEIAYTYKKHNYLEKHIDGFLQKSVLTLPIGEYKSILQRKGISRRNQVRFERDSEGFYSCPYCEYRTLGDGLFDHMKNQHKQPRFKCHWCSHRAFYRSEVRKHHRREHPSAEFQVEELDLTEITDNWCEEDMMLVDDSRDEFEGEDEESNSPSSSVSDPFEQQNASSFIDTDDSPRYPHISIKEEKLDYIQEAAEMKINHVKKTSTTKNSKVKSKLSPSQNKTEDKFKCGHCAFSASLRMKVKIHCQRNHPEKELLVVELKTSSDAVKIKGIKIQPPSSSSNNIKVQLPDFLLTKGNVFERELKAAGVTTLNLNSLPPVTFQQVKISMNVEDSMSSLESEELEDNSLTTSFVDNKGGVLPEEFPHPIKTEVKEEASINSLSSNDIMEELVEGKDESFQDGPHISESDIRDSFSPVENQESFLPNIDADITETLPEVDQYPSGGQVSTDDVSKLDHENDVEGVTDDISLSNKDLNSEWEHDVQNHSGSDISIKLPLLPGAGNEALSNEGNGEGFYSMAKNSTVTLAHETVDDLLNETDDEELLKSPF